MSSSWPWLHKQHVGQLVAAAKACWSSLTPEQRDGLSAAFRAIDTDNSGTVTLEELQAAYPK